MDDRFMNSLHEPPRPGFARDLRTRLRRHEEDSRPAWVPALAGAAAAVLMVVAFTLPSVRASAQAFLDLFRVRNFAAVPVSAERIQALRQQGVDLETLLGDRFETVKGGQPPRDYPSVDAASTAAGIDALEPGELPRKLAFEKVQVREEAVARLTIDTSRLRSVLQSLDLRDVTVPPIDGQVVEVRVPPVVRQEFSAPDGRARVELMQARSPEVTLPPVDRARLAEVGFRVLGLPADEARRFAQSIDWSSTLVVPVPAGGGTFREVEIRGGRGLLVTIERQPGQGGDARRTVLLWSEGDRVFGLCGSLDSVDLMRMANSLR
jgi:hypothetical protein